MARVRPYKIYAASVADTNAAANIQINQRGKIVGVQWALEATAGAGVDGRIQYELSTASTRSSTTNDPPGTSISNISLGIPVNGGTGHANLDVFVGGVDIEAGDRIYLHVEANGTAMASAACQCMVFISH